MVGDTRGRIRIYSYGSGDTAAIMTLFTQQPLADLSWQLYVVLALPSCVPTAQCYRCSHDFLLLSVLSCLSSCVDWMIHR